MNDKKCDNLGDFFVYRLESILTKNLKKNENKTLVSRLLRKNEDIIKNEFNFYLNAKTKAEEPQKRSRIFTILLESWRPVMMYIFMYIISQYYILNPIAEFFVPGLKLKDLPPEMWTLLTVAVGGYITSRGVEKGIQIWKGSENRSQAVIIGSNDLPSPTTEQDNKEPIDADDIDLKEEDLA